jgi:hypothetical protein
MTKWRTVLTVASFFYCVGVIFFALYPTDSIMWGEWVLVVVAGTAALGLVVYSLPSVTVPGEEFAFLLVGWAGFMTLLFYLIDTVDDPTRRAGIALFLLAGMFTGYGTFLAQDQTSRERR